MKEREEILRIHARKVAVAGDVDVVMRGYETARQIIGKHRASVRAMAEELLAVESLDSDGIKAIIAASITETAATGTR